MKIEEHSRKNGEVVKLARINVRAETSKVRKSRTLLCRNGQYFPTIDIDITDFGTTVDMPVRRRRRRLLQSGEAGC